MFPLTLTQHGLENSHLFPQYPLKLASNLNKIILNCRGPAIYDVHAAWLPGRIGPDFALCMFFYGSIEGSIGV